MDWRHATPTQRLRGHCPAIGRLDTPPPTEMRGSTIGIAIAIEKVAEVVGEILAHRAALDASESTRSEVLLYNDPMNRKVVP